MSGSPSYALIAISNLSRVATFRQAVDEALELETVVVRDGDEATAEISRHGAPKLLIVDLSLPRVDGFAVDEEVMAARVVVDVGTGADIERDLLAFRGSEDGVGLWPLVERSYLDRT